MNERVIISRNVIFNYGAKWNWYIEVGKQEKLSIEMANDQVSTPMSSEIVMTNNKD